MISIDLWLLLLLYCTLYMYIIRNCARQRCLKKHVYLPLHLLGQLVRTNSGFEYIKLKVT